MDLWQGRDVQAVEQDNPTAEVEEIVAATFLCNNAQGNGATEASV